MAGTGYTTIGLPVALYGELEARAGRRGYTVNQYAQWLIHQGLHMEREAERPRTPAEGRALGPLFDTLAAEIPAARSGR